MWVAVASWFMLLLTSRPLSKAERRCARRWLALPIEVSYRPAPTIIRMATGYWWNGYEYEKSEREARRRVPPRGPQKRQNTRRFPCPHQHQQPALHPDGPGRSAATY